MSKCTPQLIVCIGVSGAGKSTIAKMLSELLAWKFVEADDFHSAQNRLHMRSGMPLTDQMRQPWLAAIVAELNNHSHKQKSCVLAFSGLRAHHRQILRELNFVRCQFLHLYVPTESLMERLSKRLNHFMPASLLGSQLEAFQSAEDEADVYQLDGKQAIEQIIKQALAIIRFDSLSSA